MVRGITDSQGIYLKQRAVMYSQRYTTNHSYWKHRRHASVHGNLSAECYPHTPNNFSSVYHKTIKSIYKRILGISKDFPREKYYKSKYPKYPPKSECGVSENLLWRASYHTSKRRDLTKFSCYRGRARSNCSACIFLANVCKAVVILTACLSTRTGEG